MLAKINPISLGQGQGPKAGRGMSVAASYVAAFVQAIAGINEGSQSGKWVPQLVWLLFSFPPWVCFCWSLLTKRCPLFIADATHEACLT